MISIKTKIFSVNVHMIQIGLQQIFKSLFCNLSATHVNGSSHVNYDADTMSEINFSIFLYDIQ